jgi:NAD(P)-dependent dehydrogenase (short-subunit alcohol dehydrogenase family)
MATPDAPTPQTWLITGCSSGFGATFVHQLRAAGHNVIATGRNSSTKLSHLSSTGAKILDLDVTAPESTIQSVIDTAWGLFPGGIDVLVNNAGYVESGLFEEHTQETLQKSMQTNFHGPINVTRAVLPYFRKKGKGTVVYVSSEMAWHGHMSAMAYCASKFALEGTF